MSHIIKDAASKVQELGHQATLLKRWQKLPPSDKLLHLAAAEVAEVKEELEQPKVDWKKVGGEFADVFVFAVSYQLAHLPELDVADHLTSVNGSGKKSNSLDVLERTLLEVQDDPKALHQVMRQFVSLMVYNPGAFWGINNIDVTLNKVRGNRPPELYQAPEDMTDEDVITKHRHLERSTRKLRDHHKATLTPQLWQPHRELLEDWKNSEVSFSVLEQRLAEPTQVANSIEPWYAQGTELPVRQRSGVIYNSQAR